MTKLSKPLLHGLSFDPKEPEKTAKDLLELLDGISLEDNGRFENYDGSELPY